MCRLFSFLFIVSLFGCVSKEEKAVQAELNQLVGQWRIEAFEMDGTAPDSLKSFFKSGTYLFRDCVYRKKNFSACGGEIEINGFVFAQAYKYDSSTGLFELTPIGAYGDKPSTQLLRTALLSTMLLNGNWEFQVNGNNLIAVRKRTQQAFKGEVRFTATRKQ